MPSLTFPRALFPMTRMTHILQRGPVPQQEEANNVEALGLIEAAQSSDTEQTASVPTDNTYNLVALVMARPEIKSVSDFTRVAIQDKHPHLARLFGPRSRQREPSKSSLRRGIPELHPVPKTPSYTSRLNW
jgi:hypothetical protein